ncbi:MAG: type II toxin-antitoxin system RelE/ParE family toxin [Treponema sp.]|nr:type II toxin-antitoxin system RelE/ParE family toxin [Treponema sp.]
MWSVGSSDEYDAWFLTLDEDCKEAVLQRVLLLRQYSPNLPRPYADVLRGSKKYKNLKELRNQTQQHVLRVSYYFDSVREAFLLIGGDKKGKDQDKFYKDLIAESEVIIEKHEKRLEDERRNQNDGK